MEGEKDRVESREGQGLRMGGFRRKGMVEVGRGRARIIKSDSTWAGDGATDNFSVILCIAFASCFLMKHFNLMTLHHIGWC